MVWPMVVVVLAGCYVGPPPYDDSRPRQNPGCSLAGQTYSGVRRLYVTDTRLVTEPSGTTHFELRFGAEGDVLPTCVQYELYMSEVRVAFGTVAATVAGTTLVSQPIILRETVYFRPSVRALGLRSDAPIPADASDLDSSDLDAGALSDAGEYDAGI